MATKFKKGEAVKLVVTVPAGDVQALRMLEDGTVQCLISWTDGEGNNQERWFNEDDLIAA
jgi:uncharacterized protein YodC (DUF2158 family)